MAFAQEMPIGGNNLVYRLVMCVICADQDGIVLGSDILECSIIKIDVNMYLSKNRRNRHFFHTPITNMAVPWSAMF